MSSDVSISPVREHNFKSVMPTLSFLFLYSIMYDYYCKVASCETESDLVCKYGHVILSVRLSVSIIVDTYISASLPL